jgi:hypothetical protein
VPGPYAITPSGATGGTFNPGNYTITYLDGALAVTPAPLTIRADDATKVYGTIFTPAGTAFTTPVAPRNGETVGSVTEVSPAGTPPTAAVPGPYAITPSGATGGTFTPGNYTITYLDGALAVTPAPLTIRADDASKVFGTIYVPPGTAFTTPVAPRNGETVGSVTATSPGSVASATEPGSPYPITPSNATGGTFTPANYDITYVSGLLTVVPIPPVVPPVVPPVIPPVVPPVVPPEVPPVVPPVIPPEVAPVTPSVVPPEVTPQEIPPGIVPPGVPRVVLLTPPELQTLVPAVPPAPPVIALAPPAPVVVPPAPPVIAPVPPPPEVYVAPVRVRKQDRN